MSRMTIGLASLLVLCAAQANGQSVSGRVTGAVGSVGSTVGGATGGAGAVAGTSGGIGNLGGAMTGGTMSGGDLPGGFGVKAGDKVIQFRGAVGVGDDRSNFKAGVGIPF
jgi:hypothetical protein